MFDDSRDDETYRGNISIRYFCPDCEEAHIMRFGAIDDAGRGFALARDYVAYRATTGAMREARIAGLGFVGEQVYGLELVVEGDRARYLLSTFDKEATARLLMSVMAHIEPHAAFGFMETHGVEIAVDDAATIQRAVAGLIPLIGQGQPPAPEAATAPAPPPQRATGPAMSRDEFNRLMGL